MRLWHVTMRTLVHHIREIWELWLWTFHSTETTLHFSSLIHEAKFLTKLLHYEIRFSVLFLVLDIYATTKQKFHKGNMYIISTVLYNYNMYLNFLFKNMSSHKLSHQIQNKFMLTWYKANLRGRKFSGFPIILTHLLVYKLTTFTPNMVAYNTK